MTIPYSTSGDESLSIDQLINVNITNATHGNVLQYNSTTKEWENETILIPLLNFIPSLLTMTGAGLVNLSINTETLIPFTSVSAYGSASASDWNISNKEWTCSVAGLYQFVLQATGEDSTNDSITGWTAQIQYAPAGSSSFTTISRQTIYTGDDDLAVATHTLSRYYVMNAGDNVRGTVTVRVNAAGGKLDLGNTYLQIKRAYF
jgi:hypothetical protein